MITSVFGSIFGIVETAGAETRTTTNFYSDGAYDGHIYKTDPDYNTARNANSGTKDTSGGIFIGCLGVDDWKISRGFLFFDTTSLAGTSIVSVKLHFFELSLIPALNNRDLEYLFLPNTI